MRFYTLLFLVILTCLYLTVAQGSYEDCCLRYVKNMNMRRVKSLKKVVTDYREQKQDGGCNINAIVFSRKVGKVFCADPKHHWVRVLKKYLDEKKKKSNRG